MTLEQRDRYIEAMKRLDEQRSTAQTDLAWYGVWHDDPITTAFRMAKELAEVALQYGREKLANGQ